MSFNLFNEEVKKQQKLLSSGKPICWVKGISSKDYIRSGVRTAIRMGANTRNSIMKKLKALHLQSFTLKQVEQALVELEQRKEIKAKGRKTYNWIGLQKNDTKYFRNN